MKGPKPRPGYVGPMKWWVQTDGIGSITLEFPWPVDTPKKRERMARALREWLNEFEGPPASRTPK